MTKTLDSPAFNLIDEAWIPCIRADGSSAELGLREALLEAHQLRDLYAESPLMVASLYRLLLALLYSIFGVPTEDTWTALWQTGKFDPGRINAYLEKWRERFYLFHPERPFYQWADGAVREKRIMDMLPELSSGNAGTLFDHHTESQDAWFSPAQAIIALLVVQTFSFAGGSGLAPRESSDGPWARGVVFLAEGNTLFETLMLNYMVSDQAVFSGRENVPFWESENPFKDDTNIPGGFSDYLTWPLRKILLIPEQSKTGIVVRDVKMGTGLRLDTSNFHDPYYHYRIDDKRGYLIQRYNENRVLWRDSASFFSFHKQKEFRPPLVFDWLSELTGNALGKEKKYRFMAVGMANNQAKVDFYAAEHLPLSLDYLSNEQNVDNLATALQAAENVRQKLGGALARLATLMLSPTADDEGGRKPDRKDVQNLMAHWAAERHYWSALETPFFQLMRDLPEKGEESLDRWVIILQDAARQSLDYAARMAGDDARALRASVRARGQLAGGLKKLFEEA